MFFGGVVSAGAAKAVCPLCVVAVGAGLGLSRWLGVDDVVSSIWIGALLAALSVWTVLWLDKKGWQFKWYKTIITLSYFLLVLGPLWYVDIIGHPSNKIFGVDKIVFGAVIGTAVFILSVLWSENMKERNLGKPLFPYQKVVVPFLVLIITSLIFYLLITLRWI